MNRLADIRFLGEYRDFSSMRPVAVAEALHAAYEEAFTKQDFNRAGHLIASLHLELVSAWEATGALLIAVSKASRCRSILSSFLSYKQGEVGHFFKGLMESEDWFGYVGLPSAETLNKLVGDDAGPEKLKDSDLKKLLFPMVDMYLKDGVVQAYNKLKHGNVMIRDRFAISDDPELSHKRAGDSLFLVMNDHSLVSIRVSTSKARELAAIYLNNIRENQKRTAAILEWVIFCLRERAALGKGSNTTPQDDLRRGLSRSPADGD